MYFSVYSINFIIEFKSSLMSDHEGSDVNKYFVSSGFASSCKLKSFVELQLEQFQLFVALYVFQNVLYIICRDHYVCSLTRLSLQPIGTAAELNSVVKLICKMLQNLFVA